MNDARMTIRLPGETLLFAQEYARRARISLSELVLRYFNRLRETSIDKDGLPGSVREVVGIIPPDVDVEKAYGDHVMEKYL
ncbi:MAG: hypothetical protein E7049_02075 [Lentisphaerae bacterium]|nr:hypothetical protein [Lentisphaerota bacterium]